MNPLRSLKNKPKEKDPPLLPYGGQLRFPSRQYTRENEKDVAYLFLEAAKQGVDSLRDRCSKFEADVEPVGNIQAAEYIDAKTGEHVLYWFVPCRSR